MVVWTKRRWIRKVTKGRFIFYGQSLPFAASQRTVASFWQKRLTAGLSLPCISVVGKLTALDMTPLGWMGHKSSTQTKEASRLYVFSLSLSLSLWIYMPAWKHCFDKLKNHSMLMWKSTPEVSIFWSWFTVYKHTKLIEQINNIQELDRCSLYNTKGLNLWLDFGQRYCPGRKFVSQ